MRKFLLMILSLSIILVAGCMPKQSQSLDDFAFPQVSFSLSSTEVNVGEPILFDCYVSIEGEATPIEDADRVEFEVWHESQEDGDHEDILIEHAGDGHYTLEKSFDMPGTYYIYYHVDAMGIHLMEKFDFVVK
ncbi:FixH family protein [Calidifontibacillus oryziterrae]|uniref:FixH family protein n=1 Tax=Calidifontibacillus oryziterrae TaxID=1191699 RepID=UPI00035D10F0|nr:FixH family protein [Calidifontibacillus oryziterrae]